MVTIRRAAGLILVAVISMLATFAQTSPASFSIHWDTNRSLVRVDGKISPDLQKLDSSKLQQVFPVTVEPANVLGAINLPPIVGKYKFDKDSIEFHPQYPFSPGVTYRATFGKVTSVLSVPKPSQERTTTVTQIYPTTDVLPQNLLKFYLHFSRPMSGGHIYDHIHLLDENGKVIELPFLEIDEELWNPEMTRLTLFLDPGRIKRGVRPLEEVGPPFLPEKSYTLVVDAAWPDGRGVPLKASFKKKFRVTPPDRSPPDPAAWKVTPPHGRTREPVSVSFPKPMDQALAIRMISVQSVVGEKSLSDHEKTWIFKPEQAWQPGRYEIVVLSTIEDLAGNNIGKPFEVELEDGNRPRDPAKQISLFFNVD